MRTIRYLSMLVVLLCSVTAWGQNDDDFDPPGPPEPGEPVLPVDPDEPDTPTYTLTLQATDGGSIKSGSGKYEEGTEVVVEANAPATNYIFIGWNNEQGETISTTLSFTYIMPQRDVTLTAVYDFNPGSPSEPSEPNISDGPGSTDTKTLYELKLIAEEGGSITAGAGKYEENEVVTVTASAAATNFVFTGWTDSSGATVSGERSFEFTMPAHDETLTAHYDFQPGSPSEPSEPDIPEIVDPDPIPTHILTVETEEGGTVQVNGTSVNGKGEFTLEEGSEVTITTTLSTNFVFDGWYSADTLYSANKNFTFNMGISDMSLKARFSFDPNAPSEPEVPETTNSEIYLMSVVGLPGETINYPLYLNSNDTISNIQFNIQFPKMMNVDLDGVSISPEAKGYAYAHKFLGTQEDNSEEFNTYEITLTGGTTPPGNTALLIFPVTIDENIERGRFRVWVNQVIMTTTDGTEVNASVRNGAINTDYVEPDTYAYLDNLISVGSSTYSTTQAQQISHLEPFTVEVPADSISHILGCSDVSFMTFKGLESYRKITDEQTAENGFWYGKDDYVRSYVADPSVMGMAVQYNPDTHIMSIMQYPGAYEVGDADTVKVYFTYKYKYYEVELRLNIDRADILIELTNNLQDVKDSLLAAKERINVCYEKTDAENINAMTGQCDSLITQADTYINMIASEQESGNADIQKIKNIVEPFIAEAEMFIAEADSLMPLYEQAFAELQAAKDSLQAAIEELANEATESSIKNAQALIQEVNAEYTKYDVAKAKEMTEALKNAELIIRSSVGYDSATAILVNLQHLLEEEKVKIVVCYDKTNAEYIKLLDGLCDKLLEDNAKLKAAIDVVIDNKDQLTDSLLNVITAHQHDVEEFIVEAETQMPLYEQAFAELQAAKASLQAAIEELADEATESSIKNAQALIQEVNAEYTKYDVAKAKEMTEALKNAEIIIRSSVGYDSATAFLVNLRNSLEEEKVKIQECYGKTSAEPINALDAECELYLKDNDALIAILKDVMAKNEQLPETFITAITEHQTGVEEFIVKADSQIEDYTNAFESLMNMIAKLDYAIDDVQGKVPQALIDEAKEFEYFVRDAQPSFVLEEYANAEAKIAYMIDNLYASIQTEEVTVDNEVAGELDESIPVPEDVVILRVSGPLNGTDIKFIRENMPKLQVLDMQGAWIVSGGEAYLDDLHTSDLTIGDRMFAGLPTLTDIVLCDSIESIGTDVLNGTLNVSTIAIPAMTQNVAAGMLNGTKKDIKVEWNSTVAVVPSLLNGNPNLIVYAIDGVKGEKDWQNIVRNGKIESIVLRDDYAFCIPEAFTANKVQYSRKFTKQAGPNAAGGWESIVLPFDVKSIKHRSTGRTLLPFGNTDSCDARFWLASLQQNGFTASASIDANTPYIIRMPNSIEYDDDANISGVVVFSAESEDGVVMHATSEATAAQGDGYELVPSYDLVEPSTTVYVLNGNQYEEHTPGSIFVREEFGVKPFEAYVTVQDEDLSNSKFISIFENIDGIEEIKADIDNNRSIYDLYGRRIDKASMKSGNIYIINGKKLLYKVKG